MKWAIGVLLVVWLLCGLIGAWWLDELNSRHLKTIALGPISLAKAYHESPPTYPGPE